MDVGYVFQEMDALPEGFSAKGREKPWGTAHAIWCAREEVRTPFAAINADDFYGAAAYAELARFFQQPPGGGAGPEFAMVGYRLGRTLSEHGTVSRGICEVDHDGYLTGVRECSGLEKTSTGARWKRADQTVEAFLGNETVSMNFWGFTPGVFLLLGIYLEQFLQQRGGDAKAEFYIPEAVAGMVAEGMARVRVLESDSDWFGVTYREDKPKVMAALERLVEAGSYPRDLWAGKPMES
jgi:hypothetical protein